MACCIDGRIGGQRPCRRLHLKRGIRLHAWRDRYLIPRANFCGHHVRGAERDSLDAARRERLHRELARTSRAGQQSRIERQLRNIEKRSLHRAWLRDPTLEGGTIDISAVDDRCVQACLRDELGIDIERPDRVTGRELSARAVDRAKWAGYLLLQGTLDHESARRRIAGVLRDERTYWARLIAGALGHTRELVRHVAGSHAPP